MHLLKYLRIIKLYSRDVNIYILMYTVTLIYLNLNTMNLTDLKKNIQNKREDAIFKIYTARVLYPTLW